MEQDWLFGWLSGQALSVILALIPIVWLFISLGLLRMAAFKACPVGLALSLLIAVTAWEMPAALAVRAALEGAVLALMPILWVIIAAFFTFNVSVRTGAMERIKVQLSSLSGDRRVQVLLIAWGFGGFLESVAGFGTAVAIPAAILISLGFEPFFAALLCLIANTVAVAFGVIGIPVITLAKITDLPVMPLTQDVVWQLTPFALLIPFLLVATVTRSWRGLNGVWIITLSAGVGFSVAQFLVARFIGPDLPAVAGSLASCLAILASVKALPPAAEWRFPGEAATPARVARFSPVKQLQAWSPYLLLLLLVLGTSTLNPAVNGPLSQVKTLLLLYNGPGGKPLAIDWILTPGTLIMAAAVSGGLLQGASCRALAAVLLDTVRQLQKTMAAVLAIVAMAKVLAYSGMVAAVAVALAAATGPYYPLFAPAIGALGTFLTGSDTSSNVLFGSLQKETALRIGADPSWIAAANTSGACAGKLISPQSIAIAASATGLTGREGELLKATFKYAIGFSLALGLLTFFFAAAA
ncbi:MAG: L-lactate permease [Sporomusaceae bacterium]|nr:L-lactate permease [Sporomusaceae bacterium]